MNDGAGNAVASINVRSSPARRKLNLLHVAIHNFLIWSSEV